MLNVPSQSFPAPSSQQRAASGGRSKVPLKQGRSLMDWIRLTKSGKDLTGLKGRLIEVTEEELKKHNTKNDCWICLRGLVYNVSPYMEYHPGGEDELMRAAGSDGTDLFDQVHRWVNYESMLRECLVGRMAVKPAVPKGYLAVFGDILVAATKLNVRGILASGREVQDSAKYPITHKIDSRNKAFLTNVYIVLKDSYYITSSVESFQIPYCHEEKKVLNGMLPKSQVTGTLAKESPVSPSYDWFQTNSSVTIVIYTKQKDISLDSVIVDHQFDTFRAETIIKDYSYLIHIGLSHEIQEDFSVRVVENVGKIEIVLKKKDNTSWECLGHPLENHNLLILKKDTGLYYRKCQLISKENVTHDVKFFCLMLPRSTHLQVPIGQHVYLKLPITGTEIVKPYTPVSASLFSEFKEPVLPNNKYIYFLIKIYPAGLFTPQLDHLQIGDFVPVSSPEGNFKISQFQELEDFFLLAAGTGFTPMVKVLNYALNNVPSLRKAKLMFFNKTEEDIIWRSQLEKLSYKDKRFDVEFVLSAPTSEWNGKTGYISSGLLSEFLKRSSDKSKVLICICGPMPFTEQGVRLLHDLNFSKDEVHSFTG